MNAESNSALATVQSAAAQPLASPGNHNSQEGVMRRALLVCVATVGLAVAVPAAASAVSLQLSSSQAFAGPAAVTAPEAPTSNANAVYVDCHTFPGAPCYLEYFQNRGVSTVTFFATTGQVTHTADCTKNGCEKKWVGYPGFSGTAVAYVLSGPNINHVRTSGAPL